MLTSDWLQSGLALTIGIALGWLYFGSLWLTVRQLMEHASTSSVSIVLALSYLGRLALTLIVFYWLATWSFAAFVAGILGFSVIALVQIVRRARQ